MMTHSDKWMLQGGNRRVYPLEYSCLSQSEERRLQDVLNKWEGTEYSEGSQVAGQAADCFRAICGIGEEFHGKEPLPLPDIPADACMNDPQKARSAMRSVLKHYGAVRQDGLIHPGCFVITSPVGVLTGPGHAMIVGPNKTLWHMTQQTGFVRTGAGLEGFLLEGVYAI